MTYDEAKQAYKDLICLNDTGSWPEKNGWCDAPKWAVKMGKKMEVPPANPAVVSNGWRDVAKAFRERLDRFEKYFKECYDKIPKTVADTPDVWPLKKKNED